MMHRKRSAPFITFTLLLSVIFASALLLGAHTKTSAETKEECSVTVNPSQSLQETVNQVQTGSVICLEEGQWKEQVEIKKSLTLRGTGLETEIYSEDYGATINIDFIDKPDGLVKLQDLKIVINASFSGRPVQAARATLRITGSKLSNTAEFGHGGLGYLGPADNKSTELDLKVSNTTFSNCGVSVRFNKSKNIYIEDDEVKIETYDIPLRALIEKSKITRGLSFVGSGESLELPQVEVTVNETVIKGNGLWGIDLIKGIKANITNSVISGYQKDGIYVRGLVKATIQNSEVSDNGRNGINLWGLNQVKVSGSEIIGNDGSGIAFLQFSKGEDVEYEPKYEIENNLIKENGEFGVMAYIDQCPVEHEHNWNVEVTGLWGSIIGSSNSITDNDKKDVCPPELSFLQTEKGGKYPLPEASINWEGEE